jgi:hypothetical protein
LASTDFLAIEPQNITPTGGTLRWISDPDADNYKLNLYQGDQQAGDLIFLLMWKVAAGIKLWNCTTAQEKVLIYRITVSRNNPMEMEILELP